MVLRLSNMVVQINSCINVADLVDTLNASPTRAANLKHKIYYFLSLLTDTNDNYRLNSNNGGFHNMCSIELKKVLGSKDFYTIRELLLNPDDPIIELDKSWRNPNGTDYNGYCQGYKITPKYNTGVVVFKSIPNKLAKLILKQTKSADSITSMPNYGCLLSQFECNKISFDPLVYDYIYSFGYRLLDMIHDKNPYQFKLVHNIIGRWLYYIKQINADNIWRKVSDKNHRLNSSVTNLSKLLRTFLLCNGEPLECIDISSSQPYILSSVIQSRFYCDTSVGYNLYTIYPELYKELVENGCIDSSATYSSNNDIHYYTSYSGSTSYSNYLNHCSSFMWCNFFTTTELESMNRYTQSPFYLDFYKNVLDRYYIYTNKPLRAAKTDDREILKNTMMYVLFDDKRNHRNNNHHIQIFQTVYPGVDRWINQVHKLIGKQKFSYLLQRAESYLLLNVICREFNEQNPTAPLLTIHDGVFTTSKYVQKLKGLILNRLNELTGVIAGCKVKCTQIDPNPQIQDIENVWAKIEPINTEEKYLKNINGVFSSNITRGSQFLKKFCRNFLKGIDDRL
jgi:hypothetical protein